MDPKSSRQRYREYLRQGDRPTRQDATTGSLPITSRPGPGRLRSFGSMLREFLRLLEGQKLQVSLALATLTAALLLKLVSY